MRARLVRRARAPRSVALVVFQSGVRTGWVYHGVLRPGLKTAELATHQPRTRKRIVLVAGQQMRRATRACGRRQPSRHVDRAGAVCMGRIDEKPGAMQGDVDVQGLNKTARALVTVGGVRGRCGAFASPEHSNKEDHG